MQIKPYTVSIGTDIAFVTLNKKEIIYPRHPESKDFVLEAIIKPLDKVNFIEIDCGKSSSGGAFIASEMKKSTKIPIDVECTTGKSLVWESFFSLPRFHSFVWVQKIEENYLDFKSAYQLEEKKRYNFDEDTNSALLEAPHDDGNYVPPFITERRQEENIKIKVIKDLKSGTDELELFEKDLSDIEYEISGGNTLELIGTCFAGPYPQGLLLRRVGFNGLAILMNGRDISDNGIEIEDYDKLLVAIVNHFIRKGYSIAIEWELPRKDLEIKLNSPPYDTIYCAVKLEPESPTEDSEMNSISTFKP